jgi:integrase
MAKKLTARQIDTARPGNVRREISDGGSGLWLVVQPISGSKSWACRFRFDGKSVKLTLGHYPKLSLAEARREAAAALAKVASGINPAEVKRQEQIEAGERAGDTVARWAAVFLEQHAQVKTRPQSYRATERTFRLYVVPRWGGKLVGDIRRRDIIELIYDIARTAPFQANRSLAHLSRFYRWLLNRGVVQSSPCLAIERPAREVARERILSDDEIRRFWTAAGQLPAPYADIYKLLVLSGARRQEIADMKGGELDLEKRLWMLPGERAKNRKPAVFPLGPMAWEIIGRQPRDGGDVFPGHADFSRTKARLDKLMKPDAPWVTHDLRRVARSLLSRARVPQEVAELCLHHLPAAMVRRYDKFQRVDEKREAFAKLECEINLILNPPAADVLPFRR